MAGQTIVVVEDYGPTRELLGTILAEEGYGLVLVETASAGLPLIQQIAPAAVVLDLQRPMLGAGWYFLQALRADPGTARIPVVVVSADPAFLAAHTADWPQLGATVLAKPFDLNALLAAVAAAVAPPPADVPA